MNRRCISYITVYSSDTVRTNAGLSMDSNRKNKLKQLNDWIKQCKCVLEDETKIQENAVSILSYNVIKLWSDSQSRSFRGRKFMPNLCTACIENGRSLNNYAYFEHLLNCCSCVCVCEFVWLPHMNVVKNEVINLQPLHSVWKWEMAYFHISYIFYF